MVLKGEDLKAKLKVGVDLIGNTVGSTLGPKGKLVLINDTGFPYVTKDGVTVAKAINDEDEVVNSAISLIRQASEKTVSDASDGTTSSCVLAQALINSALETITEKTNIIEFQRGIDKAAEVVVNTIKEKAKKVETTEDAINVAKISANGDESISSLIGEAIDQVGLKGVIHVVKNSTGKTYLDVTKGFKFSKGMASEALLDKSGKTIIEDAYVLIYNGDLAIMGPILEKLQDMADYGCVNILLLAHSFGGGVIDNCILNKNSNVLNIYPVEAPSFGLNRAAILEDITVLTTEHAELPNTIIEPLAGKAKRVVITRDSCTIYEGAGIQTNIEDRLIKLQTEIDECEELNAETLLKERLSNLKNNVATLYIGGVTEADINERADRIDDAVGAVRSAVEEGIVVGGGQTYLNAFMRLEHGEELIGTESFKDGMCCVMDALQAPYHKLCENSNYHSPNIRIANYGMGVNFSNNKIVNLWGEGVIDSAKVARCAFENAVAVAKVFININSYVRA
jgi:chaperonin GroEL